MPTKLRMFDAFAGIGGFSRGLVKHCRTVAYCEMDPTCVSILKRRVASGALDNAPIFPDIQTVDIATLARLRPQLMTAGFPCQDISVVGTGAGLAGERSSLVFNLIRIAAKVPSLQAVLLENSPFIVGRGLEEVVVKFGRAGFRCTWGFFYASQVGALHNRKRWYCLAYKNSEVLTHVPTGMRSAAKTWKEPPVTMRLVPNDNGLNHRTNMARLAALGNAVVPQCAHEAFCVLSSHAKSGDRGQITRPPAPAWAKTIYMLNDPPRGFGTPTKTHWTQNRKLNFRMQKTMLANQLYWDIQTWHMFGRPGIKQQQMSVHYDIDPRWVELFMGYPKEWTRA